MELRVLGCHGGETPRHRTSAFLLDERIALDAGAITGVLELSEQAKIDACLVSHAHMDHVRDLATLADNRCQLGAPPLTIAGTAGTIEVLREHFFNNRLWPDFTTIPAGDHPATIQYLELPMDVPVPLLGRTVRAVPVSHTIEAAALVIEGPGGAVAYSGDTGPTDRLWEVLNATRDLRALLIEVSFPDRLEWLARHSGHHTPSSLAKDLAKFRAPSDLPTLLFHMKPSVQGEVERECAALQGLNLQVMALRDLYVL